MHVEVIKNGRAKGVEAIRELGFTVAPADTRSIRNSFHIASLLTVPTAPYIPANDSDLAAGDLSRICFGRSVQGRLT